MYDLEHYTYIYTDLIESSMSGLAYSQLTMPDLEDIAIKLYMSVFPSVGYALMITVLLPTPHNPKVTTVVYSRM